MEQYLSLNKCINDGYKFIRKITKNLKSSYGDAWFNELHEYSYNPHWNRKLPLNSLYCVESMNFKFRHANVEMCQIPHAGIDILYGLYFDPHIWEKGTVIHIETGGAEGRLGSIVLNNEDGFYPLCFPYFGIFPDVSCAYTRLYLTSNKPTNHMISLIGFNLSPPYRRYLAHSNPSPTCSNLMLRSGLLHSNVDDETKKEYENYIKWDYFDWAANRIKKALRIFVIVRKKQRHHQKKVMAELRALPGLGSDYFECLGRWPTSYTEKKDFL